MSWPRPAAASRAHPNGEASPASGEEFAWILPETDSSGPGSPPSAPGRAIAEAPFAGAVRSPCPPASAPGRGSRRRPPDGLRRPRALLGEGTGRNRPSATARGGKASTEHRSKRRPFQAMSSLRVLARASTPRIRSTQRHSDRVAALAERLARAQGLAEQARALLHAAALVHDVGRSASRLHPAQARALTRRSTRRSSPPVLGAQILADVLSPSRWSGSAPPRAPGGRGYPDGLRGEPSPRAPGCWAWRTPGTCSRARPAATTTGPSRPARPSPSAVREAGRHSTPAGRGRPRAPVR